MCAAALSNMANGHNHARRQSGDTTPAMPPIQEIVTSRLRLSTATRSDVWELWELWRHPLVATGLGLVQPFLPGHALDLVDTCAHNGQPLWLARSQRTTRLLGFLSLGHGITGGVAQRLAATEHECCQFTVAVMPQVWGCGYASEASDALLTYAQARLGVQVALARCAYRNRQAAGFLTRLGFELDEARTAATGTRKYAAYRLVLADYRRTHGRTTASYGHTGASDTWKDNVFIGSTHIVSTHANSTEPDATATDMAALEWPRGTRFGRMSGF